MKRGRAFWILALCLACLLFPASAVAAPIQLWHSYRGDEEKALEEILATWKGAPIETLAVPFDAYKAKLGAAVPLGKGPDLFIDTHDRLGDYRATKIVAPAGDALSEGVFSETALDAVREGGVAWAVPLSQKCLALYVNTDLVKEVPPDLEGIADLTGKLPAGIYPLVAEIKGIYGFTPILTAFGGRLLTEQDQ